MSSQQLFSVETLSESLFLVVIAVFHHCKLCLVIDNLLNVLMKKWPYAYFVTNRYSGFLPRSNYMHVRLAVGVNVSISVLTL